MCCAARWPQGPKAPETGSGCSDSNGTALACLVIWVLAKPPTPCGLPVTYTPSLRPLARAADGPLARARKVLPIDQTAGWRAHGAAADPR